GGHSLGLYHVACSSLEHELRHEAAFGANRNDDRVLDLLRLGQAENFGTEVLRPVRPADAATCDLAESQVQAFDARRIHEDLVARSRQRQGVQRATGELEGDEVLWLPIGVDLIEIGANGGCDRVDEAAEDAILVETFDPSERRFDAACDLGLARLALVRRDMEARVEASSEQANEIGGGGCGVVQGTPNVPR